MSGGVGLRVCEATVSEARPIVYEVIAVKISPRPISMYCGVCHQIDKVDIGSGAPPSPPPQRLVLPLSGSGGRMGLERRIRSTNPATMTDAVANANPIDIFVSIESRTPVMRCIQG